jgi:DeoR family fructose operon transcriptional repressor
MILQYLEKNEKVEIAKLHKILKVAEMTIRRDLFYLEGRGLLERIRGGAARIKQLTTEDIFEKKNTRMKEDKIAIGKAVPRFIKNNDTIFINSGTTVLQAAMNLKGFALRIITNNPALTMVDIGKESTLIMLGGEFRSDSHSIVGEQAMDMISQIYANTCIIGVDGISMKYGLTNSCFVECSINKKMIEHTHGKVIVVADHSKIGKVGPFRVAPIEDINILITTRGFPDEYYEEFVGKGVEIIIADKPPVQERELA